MERQEHLPGMSHLEILEAMGPRGILEHILRLGEKASKIEQDMNLASEVLEGAYGLTVEQMLAKRDTTLLPEGGEKQSGEKE